MTAVATLVRAAAIVTIGRSGVAVMDTAVIINNLIINNRYIRSPTATRNPFMSRRQYAIYLRNRPASILFFRLTFVDG